MTAVELLEDLECRGVRVQAKGDSLIVQPADSLSPEIRNELRQHKAEIIVILGDKTAQRSGVSRHRAVEMLGPAATNWTPGQIALEVRTRPPGSTLIDSGMVPAPMECPDLPPGVRLVQYAPKTPPIALDVCSVVTDLRKFLTAELRELDSRLNRPVQIRGGGSVFSILERLHQAGIDLEIVEPIGQHGNE